MSEALSMERRIFRFPARFRRCRGARFVRVVTSATGLFQELPIGENTVSVFVRDKAGNEVTRSWWFYATGRA